MPAVELSQKVDKFNFSRADDGGQPPLFAVWIANEVVDDTADQCQR